MQTRMMTISDIFDALAAADRPYKKAVSVERALEILDLSVDDGELDPGLFEIFHVGQNLRSLESRTSRLLSFADSRGPKLQ